MQFVEAFGQSTADSIGRNSKLFGNLAIGEIFDIKKGDGVFAGFFELLQCILQRQPPFSLIYFMTRIQCASVFVFYLVPVSVRCFLNGGGYECPAAHLSSDFVNALVDGDSFDEPGQRTLLLESWQSFLELQVCILADVLSLVFGKIPL